MALVIEDGSNVANANSYDTAVNIRAYNAARGRTISAVDATVEQQALLAMDYLKSLEPQMQGYRTFGQLQELAWPRENVILYNEYLANDVVPQEFLDAEAELVWFITQGVSLFPTVTGQPLKRKKIGPLEKEYFSGSIVQPYLPSIDAMLALFLNGSGGGLRTLRI
jgi:hypothetical protein